MIMISIEASLIMILISFFEYLIRLCMLTHTVYIVYNHVGVGTSRDISSACSIQL